MAVDTLSDDFLAFYSERCRRIVAGEDPENLAGELMWMISEPENFTNLPGAAYMMWAELHDARDLGSEPVRQHAERLMREAASQFLSLEDPANKLGDWAEVRLARIADDDQLHWERPGWGGTS